ncbi:MULTISPECIES: histidine kinase dimerization/phosphoacceptor domain -containing protein [unclassified Mesorhizobium]|uniref:histidine kinase dimerization/phosphoacceptor domain -containing protein n=1 Tax=unclassified Mesorhizobium TaxID=325217 RepID=UPI00112AEA0F|nr:MULTISPECIES: histidine kinase dimerization/phosphoacceptor domain -containing protein [unclassified Mesorhizobium]TPM92055.1 PAS domain-containing protein [Mesorhizobium sp. B2-1-3A]BCG87526.1 signal transduction histidine kinase [Mesorhizobium sp. 113-3-9]
MDWKRTREPADAWHMTDDLHVEHGKGDPFAAAIRATRMSMIITDPRRPDNPIVFANDAFLRLTGYERNEVMGKNCRFLQGPKTDKAAVGQIRAAVEDNADVSVDILNYRKDGSTFWNALYISPVSNDKGEVQFFFASQLDVSDRKRSEHRITADKDRFEKAVKERTAELEAALEAQTTLLHEVDHRVKNNLQMISSLIIMQRRTIQDEATRHSLTTMLERIEALSTVHRRLYQSKDVSRFDVSDFAKDLVTDLLTASGRSGIKSNLELEPIVISAEKATPVALMVNELVTNALKHAFKEGPDGTTAGRIGVKMSQPDGHFNIEVSDDGVGMAEANGDASFGMRLIKSLARQLHADIEWRDAGPGTTVVISMPNEPQQKRTLS